MNKLSKKIIQYGMPLAIAVGVAFASEKSKSNSIEYQKRETQEELAYRIWRDAASKITPEDVTRAYLPVAEISLEEKLKNTHPEREVAYITERKEGLAQEQRYSELEKESLSDGSYVGRTLSKRFSEYEDLFVEYSKDHPENFTREQFMALLTAIAEQESSMGYPNGKGKNDELLLGYDNWGKYGDKFRGPENQIRASAKTLREAFDGENRNYALPEHEKCMRNILSIYYLGKVCDDGLEYAESVVTKYRKWKKEFDAQ